MEPVVIGQEVAIPPSFSEEISAPEYKGRRLISHSEVDGFNQCERKHHYAHEVKLEPKKRGAALGKGSAGHLFLETFLQAIKDGVSQADAIEKALNKTAGEQFAADILPIVMYWAQEVWPTLGWKIIAVEYEFEPIGVAEGLAFPGKIDLIAEVYDKQIGQWVVMVIDHKFLYDPYEQEVFDLLPQIPKYIGVLRTKGIPVKAGMFNVLRTRDLKNPRDRYKQFIVRPNNQIIKQHMIEQVEGMKRIKANSENPNFVPMRTVNKINCTNCGFRELCLRDARGEDTQLLLRAEFQTNTYGYKEKE